MHLRVKWSSLFQDVFGNFPIPYPKREFLTDDDNEDKVHPSFKTFSSVTASVTSSASATGQTKLECFDGGKFLL